MKLYLGIKQHYEISTCMELSSLMQGMEFSFLCQLSCEIGKISKLKSHALLSP